MAAGVASRRAAYRAVRRVHERGTWSQQAVDAELRRANLSEQDRAFAANLAYETLRWEGTLDWALGHALDRPLGEVDRDLLDLLRLGAWQLLRGGVPDRAAVDTAVDVARAELRSRLSGFVNGVLRGLARRRASLPWPDDDTDDGLALAAGYPLWIVTEAHCRFGSDARRVLEAGNEPPGVTLRARGDRDALLDELAAAGVQARPGRWAPEAVLAPGANPERLAAVAEGRATPQDEASMLVTHVLAGGHDITGWRILDAAAAPGGKSTHLAELGAIVVAADRRPGRLRLVARAAQRLGLQDRIRILAADGERPPLRPGSFDAVLVDAPCSGLGVVRRRPELRWRRQPEDVAALAEMQKRLLASAAPLVRPGGHLVYTVCTWSEPETRDVAVDFQEAHRDRFAVADAAAWLGGAGTRFAQDPGVQLRPDTDGVDGMYVCRFRRKVL